MTDRFQSLHCILQSELQARVGPDVAVVCTGVDGDPESLWPEEREAISRAVPKRQREFAAGRSAARAALQRLNWPASAIPANPDRSPCWPVGLVGSIAHSADTCVAVVGSQATLVSIGVDIEPDRGIERQLWGSICTPDEQLQLQEQNPEDRASFVTRVFVAKEAFYKWHYPQQRTLLDFNDIAVKWGHSGFTFEVIPQGRSEEESLSRGRGQLFSRGGSVVACFFSTVAT